jgi:hypothetical protein
MEIRSSRSSRTHICLENPAGGKAFEARLDFTKSHVQYFLGMFHCISLRLFSNKKTIIHPHLSSLQNFQPFFKETTNPVILIPCQPPTPAAFRAARCRSWSGWLSGPRRRCGTPRWRSPWSLGNGDVAGDTWGNHRNLWYL